MDSGFKEEVENEEYRYLHTTMQLNLTLMDRTKIFFGVNPLLGFCVRLVAYKNKEDKLEDLDVDFYSTRVLVKGSKEATPTSEAIFDYNKLHHTEGDTK